MHAMRRAVPAIAVVTLLDALEAIGGDGEAVLRASGFACTAQDLRDGRILDVPRSSFARFAQECVLRFEDHGCRRDARLRFPVSRLKLMCLAMLSCPTLDTAIDVAIEFHQLAMGDAKMLSFAVEDDRAILTMDIPFRERKVGDLLVTMYGLAMFHRLLGWMTGEEIVLKQVTLAYPAKMEELAFNELLQLKPCFDAKHDSICFSTFCLRRPIVRNFSDLERLFTLFPFDLLPPDYDGGLLSDHARTVMKAAFARREALPGLNRLAEIFGLTTATLRRRLAGEGWTLLKLREGCKQDVAIELMAGSRLSIKEIAARVQFSDSATFRRAFRKWTGQSPSEYRKKLTDIVHVQGA